MMRRIVECPVLSAGEEIDSAVEHFQSLVDMALDLEDVEWAARAGKTLQLLRRLQEAGLGRTGRLTVPPELVSVIKE